MNEPFDDSAKQFYQQLFARWGIRVESQLAIFFRSRTIDLVVQCTEADRRQLRTTIFGYFRFLNALEFKGVHDPLTLADYNRILMRAWGLGAVTNRSKKQKSAFLKQLMQDERYQLPSQRTVTVVCVVRPDRILDELVSELRFGATEEPGIYHCDQGLSQWIIHPTELALTPQNYPLLPLARGEKLAQFIELCLVKGLTDYLQLILDIGLMTDPDVIWRKILEVKAMKPMIHEETWPYIDEYLRTMPDVLHRIPTFQDALTASEERGEQLGALVARRQTLLSLLQHKFGPLPDALVEQINRVTDRTQLDHWLLQVLDADQITAIDWQAPIHTIENDENR